MEKIYFDESGNTGQNPLDENDPVFSLASCRFSPSQTEILLEKFKWFASPELKFSKLRRSSRGQEAILEFLGSHLISKDTAATFIVHKPFMIIAKYCDLVLEPSARMAGINFYERGINISTANLLSMTMPVFLNKHTWSSFLGCLIRAFREKTPESFRSWKTSALLIYEYLMNSHRDAAVFFAPLLVIDDSGRGLLDSLGEDCLDPLVPAYYSLVDYWGKTLKQRFDILADDSKVLAKHVSHLLAISSPSLEHKLVGYDRRTMEFPFKAHSVVCVDSLLDRQIQLADLLAGASCAVFKSDARFSPGSFENHLMNLFIKKGLVIDALWPGGSIDPAELGTDQAVGDGQVGVVDHMAKLLEAASESQRTDGQSDIIHGISIPPPPARPGSPATGPARTGREGTPPAPGDRTHGWLCPRRARHQPA